MPTYEYQCGACGHQLEAFQKITEEPLVDCPKCGQPALGKLISATNFQLKGTGWYVTDIRDKGKPKPETEKAKQPESSEGKSDGGSSITEAKAEAKKTETKESKSESTKGDSGAASA